MASYCHVIVGAVNSQGRVASAECWQIVIPPLLQKSMEALAVADLSRYVTPSRGDGNTILGRTGLIRPDSLVSHVRALEGRWISS